MKLKTAVSLFSGIGGCSLGAEWAGYNVQLAVDHDKTALKTYRQNFPHTSYLTQDIATLSGEAVLERANVQTGGLDLLIGGPPCQGFSSAGTKFWDDPRNHLLKHYIRLLSDLKPHWFLMENVEGLLTAGQGKYIYEITKGFLEAGYTVRIAKLYADWYGLPQSRKRVFIVGNRHGIHFDFPSPTYGKQAGLFGQKPVRTIWDAISDLPSASLNKNDILAYTVPPDNDYQHRMRGECVTDHWTEEYNGEMLERIMHLKPGQTMKHLPDHLQHSSFKRRAFRRVMDGTPTEKRGGAPVGLKKLKPNQPSLTITSAAAREFIHPLENRFLTIRECARIQSFPDDFRFCGSTSAKITHIGNAIPPLIAQTILSHINNLALQTTNGQRNGSLLGFSLTKATSMSPALAHTAKLLRSLLIES